MKFSMELARTCYQPKQRPSLLNLSIIHWSLSSKERAWIMGVIMAIVLYSIRAKATERATPLFFLELLKILEKSGPR